jgi:hypothetical protein
MTDDDDFDDDLAGIQFERIEAGRYVVSRAIVVDGKRKVRRIPCNNPAYGFRRLEEEMVAEALAEDTKRARVKKRKDRDG